MNLLVSQFLIIILCMVSKPIHDTELRIDVIDEKGYEKSILVNPVKDGFSVYELKNENLYEMGTIYPFKKEEQVYICKNTKNEKILIDLTALVKNFDLEDLKTTLQMTIQLAEDSKMALARSGSLMYLTPLNERRTYVVP